MDFLKNATNIFCEGTNDSYNDVHAILEDSESPLTKKSIENLYKSVIDKGHIDFGDIPKSKGSIVKYSGYKNMVQVLADLKSLAKEDPSYADIGSYVSIVNRAIENLQSYTHFYEQAFMKQNKMLILEYNTFVFTCVEATTSLLYQFSDYLKTPSSHTLKVNLKNTKYRADLFYIEQLKEFNDVCASGKYAKYLSGLISSGTENFFGADDALVVGSLAIITTVMLSIIPVTRKLIYTFQDMRGRLAQDLELQAYFLEMNKAAVQANQTRTEEENKKILEKQEKLRVKFLRLADKLRVKSLRAEELAKKSLNDEDKTLTMDSMREQVDNGDFTIM